MMVLCAADLRDEARLLLKNAGFRGFVRIAPPGEELLVTDAHRYIRDAESNKQTSGGDSNAFSLDIASMDDTYHIKQSLEESLKAGGFAFHEKHGLLFFSPDKARLHELAEEWGGLHTAFPSLEGDGLMPAWALSERLLRCKPVLNWSSAGVQLILEALRIPGPALTNWQGLDGLRPRIAEMLRLQDRSGMRETGSLLAARLADSLGFQRR